MATLGDLLKFQAVKVQIEPPGIFFIREEKVLNSEMTMQRVFTVDESAFKETIELLEKLIQLDKLEKMSWRLNDFVIFRINK